MWKTKNIPLKIDQQLAKELRFPIRSRAAAYLRIEWQIFC